MFHVAYFPAPSEGSFSKPIAFGGPAQDRVSRPTGSPAQDQSSKFQEKTWPNVKQDARVPLRSSPAQQHLAKQKWSTWRLLLARDDCAVPATTAVFYALYVLSGASLTVWNKFLLERANFPHPVHVAWLQTTAVTTLLMVLFSVNPALFVARTKERLAVDARFFFSSVLPMAVLLAVSMVMSNAAYAESSLSFLQFVRESGVVFSYFFLLWLGAERFNWYEVRWLYLVLFGTALAVKGERHFSAVGWIMQSVAILSESAQGGLKVSLIGRHGAKVDAMTYLLLVMPTCMMLLGMVSGISALLHLRGVFGGASPSAYVSWGVHLFGSACLTFLVLVMQAALSIRSSRMGFMLADLMKDLIVIALGCGILGDLVSHMQALAFSLQVAGIYAFALTKAPEKAIESDSRACDAETQSMPLSTASVLESGEGHLSYGAAGVLTNAVPGQHTSSQQLLAAPMHVPYTGDSYTTWGEASAASDVSAASASAQDSSLQQADVALALSQSVQKVSSAASDSSWNCSTAASKSSGFAAEGSWPHSSSVSNASWERSSTISAYSNYSEQPRPEKSDATEIPVPPDSEKRDAIAIPTTRLALPQPPAACDLATVLQGRSAAWQQAPKQDAPQLAQAQKLKANSKIPKGKGKAGAKTKRTKKEGSSDVDTSSDGDRFLARGKGKGKLKTQVTKNQRSSESDTSSGSSASDRFPDSGKRD